MDILLNLENRREILEDGDEREVRKSLGLSDRMAWEKENPFDPYERWEGIFVKLDI